jgi:hypothetical protein
MPCWLSGALPARPSMPGATPAPSASDWWPIWRCCGLSRRCHWSRARSARRGSRRPWCATAATTTRCRRRMASRTCSTIGTSNLPFEDWTSIVGSERLTGPLLDRLTHYVSILSMNGDSYRLRQSARRRRAAGAEQNQATAGLINPNTGEITSLSSTCPTAATSKSKFTPPPWPRFAPPLTFAGA